MRVRDRARPTVSVIGAGYLGATHAACMAEFGFGVVAADVDAAKIDQLARGRLPFFEPGLSELLQTHVSNGRLRFTTNITEAAEAADVHFLCVGTPQSTLDGAADLSQLHSAFDTLYAAVREDALIVGKSTVPVGTAEKLAAHVAGRADRPAVELAWNPEFLREGYAVTDSLSPDRLVFGVNGPRAEPILRRVYARPLHEGVPAMVTDLATAQVIKMASNAFLATKISFINAIAELCDAAGADVLDVSGAMGLDPRIGSDFLRPGLGFGGGCLPKDLRALHHRAGELGLGQAVAFLENVDVTNMRARQRVVDLTNQMVGGVAGRTIAALGLAFKPDSDDVRDSPALDVAARLAAAGARVQAYDPAAMESARRVHPHLDYCPSVPDALMDADVVLLLTEWAQLAGLDPRAAAKYVRAHRVIDARHCLDAEKWQRAGWDYRAPGRPSLPQPTAIPSEHNGVEHNGVEHNGYGSPIHSVCSSVAEPPATSA